MMSKSPPVLPLGHHVLIKKIPAQFKSAGGIILASQDQRKRELKGRDIGRIIAFGPTAYLGFEGCKTPEDWGVSVGDVVELSGRYDGKETSAADYDAKFEEYRYVNDSDIIGKLSPDMVERLEHE